MIRNYDRQARPISFEEWSTAIEGPLELRVVQRDALANGLLVSTVWVGLNMNYADPDGAPLIFETLVFAPGGMELDGERWSTEEEARAGHARYVEQWSGWKPGEKAP